MRLVLLTFVACSMPAASLYDVVNLGGYGGNTSVSFAVNASGVAAGWAQTPNGTSVAFTSTGTPAMLSAPAQADAINTSGTVVGTTEGPEGPRATRWQNGIADAILSVDSYGLAINDNGDIAGAALNGTALNAFVRSGNTTTFLNTPGVWSSIYDLNNRGQAAGYYQTAQGGFRAFSWTVQNGVVEVGTLAGNSYAQALNDAGQIAGSSITSSGTLHAFLYDGAMHDLGTLGGLSAAYDINASGQVVGYSINGAGQSRAFVWYGGLMIDLNQLIDPAAGWSLDAAYGINDAGQITGSGTYQGQAAAFLLNPGVSRSVISFDSVGTGASGDTVPEPWTAGVVGIALLVFGARRRGRRS